MEIDDINHLKNLKKVNHERSKALELQIATLGLNCPPETRTEYEKIKHEIQALDLAIRRSREVRRQPATRKRAAQAPDGPGPYARAHARIACPYPGMVPFRAEDARFFYGRESEILQMLKHLRQRRCLYVIGPSGSGKSSLIQAGLLPRLLNSPLFQAGFWLARGMRPGAQPTQTLTEALGADLAQPSQAVSRLLAAHPPAGRLLLILDQFEELFTQASREEQARFIGILKALQEVKACTLLIAMRAWPGAYSPASARWCCPTYGRSSRTPQPDSSTCTARLAS